MRVLVTGGAGYIGSHCSRYFNEKGIETVILDNLCEGHREAALGSRLIVGDCGDGQLLDRIFSEEPYDAVIHFAAFTSVGESVVEPRKYFRNNVGNMMTLMDAAVDHGIGYFVFSSSAAVFGEPEEIPIREDHPQRPINPYGETKMIGERMLADYERAYGLHSCSFRYFKCRRGLLGFPHRRVSRSGNAPYSARDPGGSRETPAAAGIRRRLRYAGRQLHPGLCPCGRSGVRTLPGPAVYHGAQCVGTV